MLRCFFSEDRGEDRPSLKMKRRSEESRGVGHWGAAQGVRDPVKTGTPASLNRCQHGQGLSSMFL